MDRRSEFANTGYRIAVICGGRGSEREVSLVSGRAVAAAIRELDLPCDLVELETDSLPAGLDPAIHVVLPIVHGTYGEDGRLSADLDRGGFSYGGCGQASSVVCFDKLACKAIASRIGLPLAADRYLPAGSGIEFDELAGALGLPFILKPRWDGSSVGLHLVRDRAGFNLADPDLARTDYLAEAYIEGYDLTVGVLGDEALGVVGVHPEGGLYDYQHKYTSGMSRYDVPAQLEPSVGNRLRDWSLKIFRACGCRDLARVDFRTGNNGETIFLEVNTLPGMTPTSLLPKTAQCRGISFAELVLEWAGFALQRRKEAAGG